LSVLVIALNSDLHADAVVYNLNRMGVEVIRIDPTENNSIPIQMSVFSDFQSKFIFNDNKTINISNCKGILCRFAIESLDSIANDALEYFSDSESLAVFLAPLRIINSSYWINDPWIENRIDCKILQANYAQSIGLNIPEFIISTDYNEIIKFHDVYKNVIIKPLTDKPIALINNNFVGQEKINTDNFYAPYTEIFKPLNNEQLQLISNTPTFLQRQIIKKSDIRSTVIDNKIFSAEMLYEKDMPIDFRLQSNIKAKMINLHQDINNKIIKLVKKLGLRFASCDLILDENDDIYFIEANAQGNWLWTEHEAELPISEAIAKSLVYK
jgi:glutathione synthase/RimK-type ligase-like ATP-grasp enzyme